MSDEKVYFENVKHQSELVRAIMAGDDDLFAKNLRSDFGSRDSQNHTALMYAVISQNANYVTPLLGLMRKQDKEGNTALMYALKGVDLELAKLLLDE